MGNLLTHGGDGFAYFFTTPQEAEKRRASAREYKDRLQSEGIAYCPECKAFRPSTHTCD